MVNDKHWLQQSFMLPTRAVDRVDQQRRTFSPGYFKFADTTMGGNAAINPPPQSCRFADIKEDRVSKVGQGMGRAYSQNIDDASVYLHIRCGVTAHNSLTNFFGNYYSTDAARLANDGRGGGFFYTLGEIGGFVVSLGFLPYIVLGQTIRFLAGSQLTKYAYLKPTMGLYWGVVNKMFGAHTINNGMFPGITNANVGQGDPEISQRDIDERNRLLPDLFKSNGSVDVFSIATRFQRLANRQRDDIEDLYKSSNTWDEYVERLNEYMENPIGDSGGRSIQEYLRSYLSLRQSDPSETGVQTEVDRIDASDPTGSVTTVNPKVNVESAENYFGVNGEPDPGLIEYLNAEHDDGAQFITIRIDGSETVSESFSNSVKDSDIMNTMNSTASKFRDIKFNLGDGNIGDGVITNMIERVTGSVTDLMSGFIDKISLSGLAQLSGNAMVDIQKHWDSSTADLPKINFKMELRATYATELCRAIELMFPTYCMLAMVLPRSTGINSYTAPFHCEAYCKGRFQSRYAIFDQLTINRGVGNSGWTTDGKPLGIDISGSILDLSSVVHMPLTSTFGPLDIFKPGALSTFVTGDDSSFGDYMAILSSLGLSDQIYQIPKLKRNFWQNVPSFNRWVRPSNFASWVRGLPPAGVISALYNGTSRP